MSACICIYRKCVNISTVLAGQRLGIKEVSENVSLVTFLEYNLEALRPRNRPANEHRQPLRSQSVTYVSGPQ